MGTISKKIERSYKELSIHQKINYKSGWDIAIAYEGTITKSGKPYCKMYDCINSKSINVNTCDRDYNDKQKYRSLNGGRNFVKRRYITCSF